MGKKTKTGKSRRDKYYHLAKESGLRARSAFKLIQLNRRFNFFDGAGVCLDLCAAPGGWMQVAKQNMKSSSLVIGVDLVAIKPIRGCISIQADITTEQCRTQLRQNLNHAKADVVLHDGAPNVGSAWIQDAYSQSELVLKALKLATEFLRVGGVFVSKVFRSRDYQKLMWVFGQLFNKVQATKPVSSRNVSAEIFVVCQGYLAPHKIDSRMLDPRFVFSEVEIQHEERNVLKQKESKRRKAEGYEEGNYIQYKEIDVEEFIRSPLLKLPDTTEEIKNLCADLKILNKKDFKLLLKWRERVRKLLDDIAEEQLRRNEDNSDNSAVDEGANAIEKHENKDSSEDNSENDDLDTAISEAEKEERSRLKRLKKRRAKMNTKLREKLSLQAGTPAGMEDSAALGLFDIDTLKKQTDGTFLDNTDMEFDFLEDGPTPEVSDATIPKGPLYVKDLDPEEYSKIIEEHLNEQYDQYLERKKLKIKRVRHGKKSTTIIGDVSSGTMVITRERTSDLKKREQGRIKNTEDSDSDEESQEKADISDHSLAQISLTNSFPEASTETKQWFTRLGLNGYDLDADIDLSDNELKSKKVSVNNSSSSSSKDGQFPTQINNESMLQSAHLREANGESDEWARVLGLQFHKEDVMDSETELSDLDTEPSGKNKDSANMQSHTSSSHQHVLSVDSTSQVSSGTRKQYLDGASDEEADPFEGIDNDHDDENVTQHAKKQKIADENSFVEVPRDDYAPKPGLDATGLAIATQMVVRNKQRSIIDQAYNRYAHNDDILPDWFRDEENPHMKPAMPITKEMVQQIKEYERELNARPIKKVMEAKAKRKQKLLKMMSRVNQQAAAIADNDSLTEREKVRQIEQLYKKLRAKRQEHDRPTLVVARKSSAAKRPSRPKGVTGRYKMVDRRMKSDLRGEDAAKRRAKRKQKKKHR